jgi:glycosyltransferase involved in cell wall biosynthesis
MKKIYVLNVIGSLSKGGAEYQCALLSNKLDKSKFRSKTICFFRGPSPLYENLDNIIFIPRGNKWNIVSLCHRIFSVIRSENPDILHVWLPEIISTPAAIIGKVLGIPVIASHRNSTKFSGDIIKYIRDRIRFVQYIFATQIISNFYINEEPCLFKILFKLKQGKVIFNGLKEMPPISEQKYETVNEQLSLLFVGRLAPEKNLPLILRSLDILKKRSNSFKLRICGEGNEAYKFKLKNLINELDINEQVEFLGYRKNWQLFAAESLCLLLPSKSEGTANVVIESLSIGLPVMISNLPMSRSILNHEVNSLIVREEDPMEWAETILKLSKNNELKEKIKRNGIEYSKRFSIDNMVNEYEKSYRETIIGIDA